MRASPTSREATESDAKTHAETEIAALERAIAALTRRLATADDAEIAELVNERRAMREELRVLREGAAGNVVELADRRRSGR